MYKNVASILLATCLLGASIATAQSNSLYLRAARRENALSGPQAAQRDSAAAYGPPSVAHRRVGPSILAASWTTIEEPTPKNIRVHDLVTIIINEISKHSTKADSSTERESSIDFALEEWFRLTGQNLRPSPLAHGTPTLKGSIKRDFEGKGDVKREDTLSARLQAIVIDVMPNGNLTLEATHSVATDAETTQITLTGICRTKDIAHNNTILSSQLADLKITKNHTGMARDATKRGLVTAILDFLNPF